MKKKWDIVFISPPVGALVPETEKRFVLRIFFENCINVGILSLLTYLDGRGYRATVIDLFLEKVVDFEKSIRLFFAGNSTKYVGISCTSGFSYLETMEIAKIIKNIDPEIKIISGGQQVGALVGLPLEECAQIDVNVFREGEIPLEMILRGDDFAGIKGIAYRSNGEIKINDGYSEYVDFSRITPLNFSLYPSYRKFAPFIEESRGCPFSCNFCTANYFYGKGRARTKEASLFKTELDSVIQYYGKIDILNVLASSFGTNFNNTEKILGHLELRAVRWGTEIRADFPWGKKDILKRMVDSGLTILSVGVESLSKEILLGMNKTKNPTQYIRNFEGLADACSKYKDLKLKANIVMYKGETPKTFSETLKILFQKKEAFTKIRFFSLLSPPGSQVHDSLGKSSFVKSDFWDKIHIYPINLSEYYQAESAVLLCEEMNKIFS